MAPPQSGYRLLFLTLVVLGVWIAAWATGVTECFTSESIRNLAAGRGVWGVLGFIVVCGRTGNIRDRA